VLVQITDEIAVDPADVRSVVYLPQKRMVQVFTTDRDLIIMIPVDDAADGKQTVSEICSRVNEAAATKGAK
jgi:hypothetical protein